MSLKGDFWGAIVGSAIVVGLPVLVWGGNITARVENLSAQQADSRREIREDLKEINRKLDDIAKKPKQD
jgi:selenophosphate synthetase-related protein